MDLQAKTPRRRVANFTADEKAFLAQIIKKKPIVESKLTDGKSVAKKQAAWELITHEFNCNANVHKRETITLKRAWDNMKSFTRKARATERGNLIRTGGGPHAIPPPPQHGAIISMVEEAAPVIICEIKNSLDSDATVLSAIEANSQEQDFLIENSANENITSITMDTFDILEGRKILKENTENSTFMEKKNPEIEESPNSTEQNGSKQSAMIKTTDPVRRPTDYIRREAVLRIKHLENKKKMELQILKTQLEVEEKRKKIAVLEEELLLERNKKLELQLKTQLEFEEKRKNTAVLEKELLLERNKKLEMQLKTQLEVEEIKKKAAVLEEERNKILLEKAKIELEELKKSKKS